MRTQQQNSHYRISCASILLTLSLTVLFSCSQKVLAQQKDGETTAASSNSSSTTSRPVNFNIIQLMNGEYLEMFGTGTGHGILRGHPTISGIELGSLSADPLMFSTNSVERMRIAANGFVGIGMNNPATPLEMYYPAATSYAVNSTNAARIRLINSTTTANNAFEIDLGAFDNSSVPSSVVRLVGIMTDHTPGATSGDFVIGLRHAGTIFESARFTSTGNVGINTTTPAYTLDVAGPVRSSSGGFVFPDGTVQTTAGGAGSQWVTNGTSIYYNGGNVGLGTSTPGVALDVSQNKAIRVGNAILSSGGNYVHLGSNVWFNGTAWQSNGVIGGLYQISDQQHAWWSHNGAGSFTNLMLLNPAGNLGIGTTTPTRKLDLFGDVSGLSFEAGTGSPNSGVIRFGDNTGWKLHFGRSRNSVGGALNSGTAGVLMTVQDNGNVGIGTTTPAFKLDVTGQIRSSSGGFVFPDGTVQTTASTGSGSQWTTSGANIYYNSGNVGVGTATPTSKLHVQGDGRVTGNLVVDGNIAAKYQDVAEWVPAAQQCPAGTVVVLDPTKANQVISSSTSYDTRVAGVISAEPGIALGEKSDNKVLVATTGRVRVRVDATNGPIQIGDLLVTSDREGFAMKSMPMEIGSSRIHRPGTLIGKALEPLAGGTGEILVLLSLQ